MNIKIHIDLTSEEGGFEEVEKTIQMGFVPPIGMSIQMHIEPLPENRIICRSLSGIDSSVGSFTVEDLHYTERTEVVIVTGSQHYKTRKDLDGAIDSWVHCYCFKTT